MSAPAKHSILVVTAAPDDRSSTRSLRLLVDELRARPDTRVEVWFLRAYPEHDRESWPDSRVVDALRTWWPARVLDALALRSAGAALRGARLKWWNRRAAPSIVVLDDGVGERVLSRASGDAVVVLRPNVVPPDLMAFEAATAVAPVVLDPTIALPLPGIVTDPGGVLRVASPHPITSGAPVRAGRPHARTAARARMQLPADAPLVVGWGDDGWLDGPDAFVRALWALDRHQGIEAHGVWLGLQSDPRERERLESEAHRCGVGERFHVRPPGGLDERCCGDAVFLPFRSAASAGEVLDAISAGLAVVTFLDCGIDDQLVRLVPYLDIETAGVELAASLRSDRSEVANAAAERLSVERLADRLVRAAGMVR